MPSFTHLLRRIELRNTTITEILLVFVFLILLLLQGAYAEISDTVKQGDADRQVLEAALEEKASEVAALKDEFRTRGLSESEMNAVVHENLSRIQSANARIATLVEEKAAAETQLERQGRKQIALKAELERLSSLVETLRRQGLVDGFEPSEDAKRFQTLLSDYRSARKIVAVDDIPLADAAGRMQQKARTLGDRAERAERRVRSLETQMAALRRETTALAAKMRERERLIAQLRQPPKAHGMEPGNCWNRKEYLYGITIEGNDFVVTRKWPSSRDAEVRRTPALKWIEKERMNRGQFKAMGRRVYEYSLKQNPSCRYFVDIDLANSHAPNTLEQILFIERFFFKNISR